MSQNDIINAVMAYKGVSSAEVREAMGISTRQQMGYKMDNGTIRVDELIQMLDVFGFELVLRDLRDGRLLPVEGIGGQKYGMRGNLGGLYRNNKKCHLLSLYEEDGVRKELYQDPRDDAYFLACYAANGKVRKRIVNEARAKAIIEAHPIG